MKYAGPDVIDYFRNTLNHNTYQLDNKDVNLDRDIVIYDYFNSTYIGDHQLGFGRKEDDIVYYKKDKSSIQLSCESVTDYGEITGTIGVANSGDNKYFYFKNIKSFYAYDLSNTTNKGTKVSCYHSNQLIP
jgi:hypothetical protein